MLECMRVQSANLPSSLSSARPCTFHVRSMPSRVRAHTRRHNILHLHTDRLAWIEVEPFYREAYFYVSRFTLFFHSLVSSRFHYRVLLVHVSFPFSLYLTPSIFSSSSLSNLIRILPRAIFSLARGKRVEPLFSSNPLDLLSLFLSSKQVLFLVLFQSLLRL